MLTGRRAFDGEDISDTLAAVLTRDPDWPALPADTPRASSALLDRCLERESEERLRDIGEARRVLDQSNQRRAEIEPAPVVDRRRPRAAGPGVATRAAVGDCGPGDPRRGHHRLDVVVASRRSGQARHAREVPRQ